MVKNAQEYRKLVNERDSSLYTFRSDSIYSDTPSSARINQKKFPIRTGLAALGLFSIGCALFFTSIAIGLDDEYRGISIFVLGLIAFIPGSYAVTQLYGAFMGWKGYSYDQIPSYDS